MRHRRFSHLAYVGFHHGEWQRDQQTNGINRTRVVAWRSDDDKSEKGKGGNAESRVWSKRRWERQIMWIAKRTEKVCNPLFNQVWPNAALYACGKTTENFSQQHWAANWWKRFGRFLKSFSEAATWVRDQLMRCPNSRTVLQAHLCHDEQNFI